MLLILHIGIVSFLVLVALWLHPLPMSSCPFLCMEGIGSYGKIAFGVGASIGFIINYISLTRGDKRGLGIAGIAMYPLLIFATLFLVSGLLSSL